MDRPANANAANNVLNTIVRMHAFHRKVADRTYALSRYSTVYACNHIHFVSLLVSLSVGLCIDTLLVSLYCTCMISC